ncbi:hypothetical protein PPL_09706 [Heterostelium album PN500]|uniref:Uncharacterized protein n=1 Tax=Heterostelium pallidum (strain ATCC 26659 / Pp 5 / PN500) TaxID=670386 RepID=D3BNK3_HETP5|nr:hypothetical protein PPL_09706 [Heterostelium album PN500]EFA76954.1 hypothetical protein PPL_09706 [Heterostelium album PN500]|eukprot:XP_020429086.1 hypothetical protein PPL_09706 [Heterostelium album PN500]
MEADLKIPTNGNRQLVPVLRPKCVNGFATLNNSGRVLVSVLSRPECNIHT